MSKRANWLGAACVLLLAPLGVWAQPQPTTYKFVTEWTIPRAHWTEWAEWNDKQIKPIFEKMTANGTLIGWGIFATEIHETHGPTHGAWIEAHTVEAIDKTLAEIAKLPPNAVVNDPKLKHRDYLLRNRLRGGKPGSGSGGMLWVNRTQNQPGKFEEYLEVWDRHVKPMFEDLVSQGAIAEYGIESEVIHTQSADVIYIYCVATSPAGMDKFLTAIANVSAAMPPDAHKAIEATEVAAGHGDYFARVNSYAVK